MQFLPSLLLLAPILTCQDPGETSSKGPLLSEIRSGIWCQVTASNGDLWLGSDGGGLYRHDGERLVQYTLDDGLPGMRVRSLVDDQRGGVLVSTTDGVCRFDGERFTGLEVEELSGADGWRLDPTDVWFALGYGEGGPCRYDGERLYRLELTKSPAEDAFRRIHPQTAYAADGVYCVYRDRRGHVWFGTATVGLCRYDGENLAWMYEERLTNTPSGGSFGIRCIYEDRAGDFWICNTRQRFEFAPEVSVRDGYTLLQYETKEGLPASQADGDANFFYFASMIEDDSGSLWMTGGTKGLFQYDGKSVTGFPIGDEAFTLGVQQGPGGGLWIGTAEHGLYTLGAGRLEPLRSVPAAEHLPAR